MAPDPAAPEAAGREWPAPVSALFAGRLSEAGLRAEARKAELGDAIERLCQADFYIGQWHLVHGRPAEGRTALQQAVVNCPGYLFEYHAAVAEMRRLGDMDI
jgi:lipoprotein NlpI